MSSRVVTSEAGLKHARRIRELSMELYDRAQAMEKELTDLQAALTEKYKALEAQVVAEVEAEWYQLCDVMKIGTDERAAWHLNASFLDEHGLAFVVYDQEKAQHLAMIQSRLIDTRHKH